MKFKSLVLVTTGLCVFLLSGTLFAFSTVDQANDDEADLFDWTIIYSGTNAQSFTPTVETLSAVELLLNGLPEGGFAGTKRCKPNSSNTIRVDVRDSTWTLIGSTTQTVTLSGAATIDPSEWVRFGFADDIALTPGSLYSFEPIVSGPFPSGCERIMWAFEWNLSPATTTPAERWKLIPATTICSGPTQAGPTSRTCWESQVRASIRLRDSKRNSTNGQALRKT